MKLYHKDIIGFSFLIFITVVGGLYLYDNQLKILSVSEYHDKMGEPAVRILDHILASYEKSQQIRNSIILSYQDFDDYDREYEKLQNLVLQYEKLIHELDSNQNFLADSNMRLMMQDSLNEINVVIENSDKINQQIFVLLQNNNLNEIQLDEQFLELNVYGKDITLYAEKAISMELEGEEFQKNKIRQIEVESSFAIIVMMVLMLIVIIIIIFSRTPMMSNIKNIKNATTKISEGKFDTRIPIAGGKDEISELCISFNDMAKQLSELNAKLLYEIATSKEISDNFEVEVIKQKNLQKALDESSDVSITNEEGIITYVNDRFCKLTQYSRDEIIGKTHSILKSGFHSDLLYKNLWDTILSGKIWHDRIQNKKKDGTFYWVDIFIVPFFDKNNEIHEFISIRRDITERMTLNAEKLKNERMVTLGNFTSRLAHDLRNPLSIIQVSLENMKLLYGADGKKQSIFDKVNRSISRMTHQVDDVLSYVKGDPVAMNRVRFSELMNEATDSLTIPDRIQLILPKNDFSFVCDQKQFAIAINNLILNSIQAISGKGEIKITIEENLAEVIIKVIDSGVGIPKDEIDKVFEPLFTTKLQGTGLGLISVKSIVELHGGFISVTSPPTTFTISLPKVLD